jgi:hypothetical protein
MIIPRNSNTMDKVTPGTPALIGVVSGEALHFDYPGSDTLLRSCDSHDFRVPQLYIANSSPVLGELIRGVLDTVDVANGEEKEPLPMVELPETGAIVYSLLTFIFPVAPVLPSTTENTMKLLAVAQKYQMESVMTHVRSAIFRQDPPFIHPETSLHVYSLAQEYELHEEALLAARSTLRLPTVMEDLGDKTDFMPGAYLLELWKYHESVKEELASSLLEFRKFGIPHIVQAGEPSCRSTPPHTSNPILQWLDGYIESLAQTPHLFDLAEFEHARAQHIKGRSCSCADISSQTIRAFWEDLTAVVNGAMEKVRGTDGTRIRRDDGYELHAGRFDSGSRERGSNFRKRSSIRAIVFGSTRCKYYNSIVGPGRLSSPQVIACPLVTILQKPTLSPATCWRIHRRPSCSPIARGR